MGELIIHRKAYARKAYTRKDGTRVKATHVPPSVFNIKDRGKKGRTPKSDRWAQFNTVTGWKKTQNAETRHREMLSATDKNMSLHDRYVQAGRRLNQLANVTTDKPTEKKARADANYFFKKASKTS
jgi:hypothetical protein